MVGRWLPSVTTPAWPRRSPSRSIASSPLRTRSTRSSYDPQRPSAPSESASSTPRRGEASLAPLRQRRTAARGGEACLALVWQYLAAHVELEGPVAGATGGVRRLNVDVGRPAVA